MQPCVMMKQDTTRALQQSQIKWNDKNTSAAISYIYSSAYIRQTGNGLIPDFRNISVCEHPTINENTKNRYTTLGLEAVHILRVLE